MSIGNVRIQVTAGMLEGLRAMKREIEAGDKYLTPQACEALRDVVDKCQAEISYPERERLIDLAREKFTSNFHRLDENDIEIDPDAQFSPSMDGGVWVSGWLWVEPEDASEDVSDAEISK